MESEWVACSTAIELASGPHLVLKFVSGRTNNAEVESEGPVLCDNRSAVLSGRKGTEGIAELKRPTRHIALRHQRVLENAKRLFYAKTTEMRADGLSKSSNTHALRIIFEPDVLKQPHVKANLAYEFVGLLMAV